MKNSRKKTTTKSRQRSRTITALLLIVLSVLGIALFFRTTTIGDDVPTTTATTTEQAGQPRGNIAGNAIAGQETEDATYNYNSFVRRQQEKIKEINEAIQEE